MKPFWRTAIGLLLAAGSYSGCRTPHVPGGVLPDAGQYTIHVLVEPGGPAGVPAAEMKQREQVCAYMEKDLVNVLNKRGGYQAQAIRSRSQFTGMLNQYLLAVKIARYDPGSKAARVVVGYGAGSTSLDIHYEFYGGAPSPLIAANDGVGSGRDWNFCVRKLNENMLAAVTAKLRELPSVR